MIKNSKIVIAIVLCLVMLCGVTGCAGSAPEPAETDETEPASVAASKEADIVVVGGGGAGMCAAVEAASTGASVIVLEKAAAIGGATNFAEGVFAVESVLQQELGITTNKKEILKTEYEFQNYKVNTKLWEETVDMSAENISWLLDLGVEFATVTSPCAGEKTWHVYAPYGEYNHGAALIQVLKGHAEDLGVEILVSTPGTELIMDGDHISGVKATQADGSELVINSKAVILATGGLGANQEMLLDLTNLDVSQISFRGIGTATGDGIRMAREVGAFPDNNITVCMLAVTMDNKSVFSEMSEAGAMEPTNLWVNQDALRYVPEDILFHQTRVANALLMQDATYSIMDSASIDRLVNEGCISGYGLYVLAGQKLTGLEDEIAKAIADGDPGVFKADTLEELAEQMGVNPDTLVETVEEYNTYCDNGEDLQYEKDPQYLREVRTGPFYAFRLYGSALNTMGGLKINVDCEVLDQDKQPINGLYAAGMDVSGYAGETYGIVAPGSDQGIAVATGRIAAISAVEYCAALSS